ncbi:hypothetical protein MMC13_000507 [Lambiella insularis]|nr:hypothetical protein [Lambiella insularis]
MTSTGLNTVNLGSITTFQQSVLFVLMFIGNITTLSVATVAIRRHYYRTYMRDFLSQSKAGREIVNDIDHKATGSRKSVDGQSRSDHLNGQGSSIHNRLQGVRERKTTSTPAPSRYPQDQNRSIKIHEKGHGGLPFPWEISIVRKLRPRFEFPRTTTQCSSHHYLSFETSLDKKGRFHSLSEAEREEFGGVEYRALSLLMWLLPAYILFWLVLTLVILIPAECGGDTTGITARKSQSWLKGFFICMSLSGFDCNLIIVLRGATFLAISAFGNCGLNILKENMIRGVQGYYLVLIVSGISVLAGNTFFPVFLRITIWAMSKLVSPKSRLHHTLAFLLQHPRRCFLMLFPDLNTWYLAGIQATMHIGLWVFWIILQINLATVWSIPPGPRTISGLFQALGVRTGGFYIITMSDIAPALSVLYVGASYVSGLPIILSLRSTNIYEERSVGVKDDVVRGQEGDNGSETSYISTHLKYQLASDAWWLFFAIFLICIVERDSLGLPAPGFSIWNVIFDTVSAFGTVSISTGAPYDNYSFCGAWFSLSKVILMAVMIRGRHRSLPMAIDHAVLLPGQELMEKMDREYHGGGGDKHIEQEEARVREDEEGSQVEKQEEGQDPEQDVGIGECGRKGTRRM